MRRRPAARVGDDAGIGMLIVLMCMVMSVGLVLGMLGILTSELVPTAYERKSERTIAGAQAGLQVGLAAVRQAYGSTVNGRPVGDPSKLPCGPINGTVGGLDASQPPVTYAVTIRYYTVSPKGQSASWRSANALGCGSSGTSGTPVYALVQSSGVATAGVVPAGWGDRSTEVVYLLNRTDQAVLGGHIHSDTMYAPSNSVNWCWQAASYPPAAGTAVVLAACVAGRPAQSWAYRSDYSVVLSGTQNTSTSPPSGGLCINADTRGNSSNITGASLQPCVAGQWSQLWGYSDWGEFQGVNPGKTALANECLTTNGTYQAGAQLTVGSCDHTKDEWAPEAAAGAGAAGAATQQLVNYGEYGRCLDVSNAKVDSPWLIDYPCKADPTGQITWNQRFAWDGAGTRQIVTNSPSGPYCLTSPSSAGAYVLTTACDSSRADQRWSMLGATGVRSTAYTIVDGAGRCLGLGPPGTSDPYLTSWSSIVTEACDGSYEQKWNSPPLPVGGNLAGERETTGGR